MFERYTESARRAIYFARAEALQRSAAEIDTSDVLLGLLREPCEGDFAFATLPRRFQEFRTLFGAGELRTLPESKDIALTSNSKIALAYAVKEADRDGNGAIDREHLLRGILLANDDTSNRLSQAGVMLESFRSSHGPKRNRPGFFRSGRWLQIRKLILRIAGILGWVVAAILYLRSQDTPR